jgi:LytS/YehU family sensor histidine kinase
VLERLHIEVLDSGPGIHREVQKQTGLGLANTRARLQQLYGDKQQFALSNAPEGGLMITIDIPFRAHHTNEAPDEVHLEYEDSHADR